MKRILPLGVFLVAHFSAQALSLGDFLDMVKKKNGGFESTTLSKLSAESKVDLGDLVLSPYLNAKANWLDDQSIPQLPAFEPSRTQVLDLNLGVSKNFASGTGLQVGYDQNRTNVYGLPFPVGSPWTGGLTFGFTQSLIKDGFGSGTKLRRERESETAKLEKLNQESQARQILVDAESAYWDAIAQQEETRIDQDSLELVSKLVDWTKRRLDNGIADRSDFYQVQALYATRQMQLVTSQDNEKAAFKRLADLVAGEDADRIQKLTAPYGEPRDPASFVRVEQPTRIDAVIKSFDSKVHRTSAEELDNSLRPDLSLQASLAANTRDASYGGVYGGIADTSHPTTKVGVVFSLNLDQRAVEKVRAGARADARASEARARQAGVESNTSWSEILRRHQVLTERIKIMEGLVQFDNQKVKRENERLGNGRTTTFQVISFEEDQADAQVLLLKLKVEQRKLEAQTRLFISRDGSEVL